jgi:hypothetical protein
MLHCSVSAPISHAVNRKLEIDLLYGLVHLRPFRDISLVEHYVPRKSSLDQVEHGNLNIFALQKGLDDVETKKTASSNYEIGFHGDEI